MSFIKYRKIISDDKPRTPPPSKQFVRNVSKNVRLVSTNPRIGAATTDSTVWWRP